jgi:hypothetical protein
MNIPEIKIPEGYRKLNEGEIILNRLIKGVLEDKRCKLFVFSSLKELAQWILE